jgi:hypothetical protein
MHASVGTVVVVGAGLLATSARCDSMHNADIALADFRTKLHVSKPVSQINIASPAHLALLITVIWPRNSPCTGAV